MRTSRFTLGLCAFCLVGAGTLAGCTTYYAITDPSSGKTYYTTDYKTHDGALIFEDDATGNQINIQNGEIAEITKDQYQQKAGG